MTLEILAWDRHTNVVGLNQGLLWLPKSRSQKNRQVPVLKARSQLKFLQRANFFEPKLWMIAFTTTSFMYKWSGFVCTNVNVCIQGRIQDFKLGGGGTRLKNLRRAKGSAKIFGVFRVKNHDFTPKNHIFSNCGGRHKICWGISCEKSRFYAKKLYFFQF